jgi:hypothetical protein
MELEKQNTGRQIAVMVPEIVGGGGGISSFCIISVVWC